MSKTNDPLLLDVTIRDGSYLIDYQYTPSQVAAVVQALDAAGIDYVEVGHGSGLGAAENAGLKSAASDAEYVAAARGAAKQTKIGVIAGPEPITRHENIDRVIDALDFIRFGANCHNPGAVKTNIEYAKKKRPDLQIFFQLMRSTRRPTDKIVEAARQIEDMGVDFIYVVDTIGHFIPEEVADLVAKLVASVKIAIGFHGHNNLGLANVNSMAAVAAGATLIDGSLRGAGRGAGNAQLDQLVSLLQRHGLAQQVDLHAIMQAGDKFIEPIIPPTCGVPSIDVMTADANIDLYPLAVFERLADKAKVKLADLIYELGKDPDYVEAEVESLRRALTKLGANADMALAAVGLIR